ncbi:MAG TPA: HPr family phosphocarrier protein [Roseburia sp.]|nr:HPr family phosphocarrier protein [Roseburia sp.]
MEIIMKKSVVVNMQDDLEARPIALLVQKANQFSSQIYMESEGNKRVNVKSIMGMMSMALLNGEEVVIDAEGEDAQDAVAAIEEFLTK